MDSKTLQERPNSDWLATVTLHDPERPTSQPAVALRHTARLVPKWVDRSPRLRLCGSFNQSRAVRSCERNVHRLLRGNGGTDRLNDEDEHIPELGGRQRRVGL